MNGVDRNGTISQKHCHRSASHLAGVWPIETLVVIVGFI